MTLRRKINIYDYPEHLNPFREDADENTEKSNTTDRRHPSFRVNAWNVLSSNKGKSNASEDINRVSSTAASRFMTWTPKLLRKASFRQSSRSTATERQAPRETLSPISLRLSFRHTASQRMVTPTSSRSSLQSSTSPSPLHSSESRASLPPDDSRNAFPSSRLTSPPSRPAPPNVRTSLSPSRSLLAPTAAPCTENTTNNVTAASKTTPILAARKTLFPESPSEKIVGEQALKGETKYIQQGAKPKKKRRAPAPPTSSPGKSISDNRQANSNESDGSMTSSVTSSSAEELPSQHDHSAAATSDLEVISQEPELDSKNRESDSPGVKEPEQANRNCESRVPEHHFENRAELPDTLQPRGLVHNHVSEHSDSGDETSGGKYVFRKDDDTAVVDHEAMKHLDRDENLSSKSEDVNLKLRSTSGNEMQENGNQPEDGHPSCQQGLKIHQEKSSPGNESRDGRKHSDDGVRNTETSTKIPEAFTENSYRLQNGKSCYSKDADVQNEGKMYTDIMKTTAQLTPKPKPRTVLSNTTKN